MTASKRYVARLLGQVSFTPHTEGRRPKPKPQVMLPIVDQPKRSPGMPVMSEAQLMRAKGMR